MTDSSGDGISDELAESLGLDPRHEHHPSFVDALLLVVDVDPEFAERFVETMTVDSGAVPVPFYRRPVLEDYVSVGTADPDVVPALNEQLLARDSMELIAEQLSVLAGMEPATVRTLAAEGRLGESDWSGDGTENWLADRLGVSPLDADPTGDGLSTDDAISIGLDPSHDHAEIGAVAAQMRTGSEPLSPKALDLLALVERDYNGVGAQILERDLHREVPITRSTLEQASDPDADGLITAIEEDVGTDPRRASTSGDRLHDGWKYRGVTPDGCSLPDARLGQMDLYVQVLYAPHAEPLTDDEKATLREWWAEFDIENPDGSTGINLHIEEGPNGGKLPSQPGENSVSEYALEYYTEEYMNERHGVYHLALFAELADNEISGQGIRGGRVSVTTPGLQSEDKLLVFSHELLHNIVGNLDPRYVSERQRSCEDDAIHTCTGILTSGSIVSKELVSGVEEQLARNGYAYR